MLMRPTVRLLERPATVHTRSRRGRTGMLGQTAFSGLDRWCSENYMRQTAGCKRNHPATAAIIVFEP
jgi:hypothetical protein